jgi:hypothetical protein
MLAIAIITNLIFHARSKNIELHHHFIHEMVNKKELYVDFINTSDQPRDVLIKTISSKKFQ